MAQHTLFKGIKRVLTGSTAYTATTNNDYLYFVRKDANTFEGDIWFQGTHYGHFGENDLDDIKRTLDGFLSGGTASGTTVKDYIDAAVSAITSGMTTSVELDPEAFSGLTIADKSTTPNVKDYVINLQNVARKDLFNKEIVDRTDADEKIIAELNDVEAAVGLTTGGTYVPGDGKYTSGATSVANAIDILDDALASAVTDLEETIEEKINELDATVSANSRSNYMTVQVAEENGKLTSVSIDDSALKGIIEAMDYSGVTANGQAIVNVTEQDGKIAATQGDIAAGHVTIADAGSLIEATNVEGALQELASKAAAITISNVDGSVNVTTSATGTDINVNIKSGEKVLAKDGNAGLYTDIKLSGVTPSSAAIKEEFALIGTDGSVLGDHIKVYKDSHIVSITYITDTADTHYQNLEYKYIDASGETRTEYVDISSLVLEAEFASGVTVTNHVAHGVVDPASEKDSNNDSFLTVGADGFKVDGIKDEIDAKIAALDKTDDAAVAGQYVAAIEETDGVVAVKTRANVSEAVLNNYAKGTDATAVAATDTVNQAVSKLENQIDKAKAAATTKVVGGTDAGNNMTIASATSETDGSVTYTINLTDVASKAALDAEIAARKAVDGQNGDTYAANTGANYISGATSLNDADVKLDTALKALSDQVSSLDYTGLTNENTKVVTDVKENDGLVSASATTVGDLVITAITTADTKVAANDNLATIAGKLQGQINAMDLAVVSGTGAAIVSVSEEDGKVSATTGNVDTDHVVLASALTGTSVTPAAGTSESTVLQQIVNAIDNLGGNALTGVTSTGETLHVDTASGNVQNIEINKQGASLAKAQEGHIFLEQDEEDSKKVYGAMYWIDEEN